MPKFKQLQTDFGTDDVINMDGQLDTLKSLDKKIQTALSKQTSGNTLNQAFKENGVKFAAHGYDSFNCEYPCSVLKTEGGGWQKGKIRFRYVVEIVLDEEEVISSEPESPLDDIRQSIQEQTKN